MTENPIWHSNPIQWAFRVITFLIMELDVTMSQNRVEFALLFYDISEGVALSDHQAGSGPFVHIVELVLQSDEIPLKNCNCHS